MLKLLRRKSFRKSKDLNSESGWRGSAGRSGQYSVSSSERQRRSSGLQSTHSLSQTENNYNSLDRSASGQQHSRDNVRTLRSRYSSLSNTNSEDNPPEILQYARPPENVASPSHDVEDDTNSLSSHLVDCTNDELCIQTTVRKISHNHSSMV